MQQPPATKVSDLMTRRVVTVSMDDTLRKVRELFDQHRFHHLLVVDARKIVGIISDRDLLRNISPFVGTVYSERSQDVATLNKRAHQIMTHKPVVIGADATVSEAITLVLESGISCLPVVDAERRPIGIVTWRDLLRANRPAA